MRGAASWPGTGVCGDEVSVNLDVMLVAAALPCDEVFWQHLPFADAAIGALAMKPAFERREHREWVGSDVAIILVVMARCPARRCLDRHRRFRDPLL